MKFATSDLIVIAIFFFSSCQPKKVDEQNHLHDSMSSPLEQTDTLKKSVPKEAHAQIGNAHIMIKYHAPAVRGRTIWGGLVSYEDVWVTGAHRATTFEIDNSIIVDEKEIPAGKYALFTIPGKDKWKIILNSNWEQHLADEYDEKEDVIRLDVTPQQLPNVQERLHYEIIPDGQSKGLVTMAWEKVKISMPFQIK